jgi:hypothetical protein
LRAAGSDLANLALALSLVPASVTVALAPDWLTPYLAAASVSLHVALRGPEATLGVARFLAPFLAVFAVASSVAQLAVAGAVDLVQQCDYSLRATSLAMLSSLVAGYVSPAALVRALGRLSPDLAVALAVSLKLLRDYPRLWRDLTSVYSVNLGGGRWSGLRATVASVRALASSSVHLSLQVAEVLSCRVASLATGARVYGVRGGGAGG